MTTKRSSSNAGDDEGDDSPKRPKIDNEPLPKETTEPEKREALRRLYGRLYINAHSIPRSLLDNAEDGDNDDIEEYDPLMDEVPDNLDPELLGFLLCAQETLRFLIHRGITAENPLFVLLRTRLLQGIADIAAA